jgi:hypothetical protein
MKLSLLYLEDIYFSWTFICPFFSTLDLHVSFFFTMLLSMYFPVYLYIVFFSYSPCLFEGILERDYTWSFILWMDGMEWLTSSVEV